LLKCSTRFDLQDDTEASAIEALRCGLKFVDVRRVPNERVSDNVRMSHDERQIPDVLFSQGGQMQGSLRQVDPFVRTQSLPADACLNDSHSVDACQDVRLGSA
jgi:hypothetical protein